MKIRVASSFWDRLRGLMFVKDLPSDEGLLIERCNSIHTCFMRFSIDATFMDAEGNIVKTVRNIKPWRWCVLGGRRAVKVLETKSAEIHSSGVPQKTSPLPELNAKVQR